MNAFSVVIGAMSVDITILKIQICLHLCTRALGFCPKLQMHCLRESPVSQLNSFDKDAFLSTHMRRGVVAPWCNPLTLQPEQSGGVGSSPGRAPSLERHDKGSRTRLGLLYFCDPSAWR